LETKKSKSIDNKDNGKKDIEDNYNTSSGQYTFDSSDPKEIMTGIGEGEGEEKIIPILILINILSKTSRKLLKMRIVNLVKKKKVRLKEVQNNQIIKMNEDISGVICLTNDKFLTKIL
jgi:hypothetical protein